MPTIDWATKVITLTKTELKPISGTLYELDTDAFRLQLRALEASAEGAPYEMTHRHNTAVTVAGTTFARTVEIINGYSVQFEDGQYSVRLVGSNNNIFDIENGILTQNQVQVIPNNSAGLVEVTSGSGLSEEQDTKIQDIKNILEADEEYTATKAIKKHKDTKDVLVEKDVTGDSVSDGITLIEPLPEEIPTV